MDELDLDYIYAQLKNKYDLELSNSFSLDAGFSEDFPVLHGFAHGQTFWLYEYGGDFVFSVEVPGQEYHDHWHPHDAADAVRDIEKFMQEPDIWGGK